MFWKAEEYWYQQFLWSYWTQYNDQFDESDFPTGEFSYGGEPLGRVFLWARRFLASFTTGEFNYARENSWRGHFGWLCYGAKDLGRVYLSVSSGRTLRSGLDISYLRWEDLGRVFLERKHFRHVWIGQNYLPLCFNKWKKISTGLLIIFSRFLFLKGAFKISITRLKLN